MTPTSAVASQNFTLRRSRLSSKVLLCRRTNFWAISTLTALSFTCRVEDRLSQCSFNSTAQCGYHSDLNEAAGLLFLKEDRSESIVTVESTSTRYFRRLASVDVSSTHSTARSLASIPRMKPTIQGNKNNTEAPAQVMQLASLHIDTPKEEPFQLSLKDTLRDIKSMQWGDEDPVIWSIEMIWKVGSPFRDVEMERASSLQKTVGDSHHTIWRLFSSEPMLAVFPEPHFVGQASLEVNVHVKRSKKIVSLSREIVVNVFETASVSLHEESGEEHMLESESLMQERRRLLAEESSGADFPISAAAPPSTIELWPVEMSSLQNQSLRVSYVALLGAIDGIASSLCQTTISTFDNDSSVQSVRLESQGAIQFTDQMDIVHPCNESLKVSRELGAVGESMVVLQVNVKPDDSGFVTYAATIPVVWSILPLLVLPDLQIVPIGSVSVEVGASITIQMRSGALPHTNMRIEIVIANCSDKMSVVASSNDAEMVVDGCTLVLQDGFSASPPQVPLDIQLARVTDTAMSVPIQLTVSTFAERSRIETEWSAASSSISVVECHFCELSPRGLRTLYALEAVVQEYKFEEFASMLFTKARTSSLPRVTGLSLIWSNAAELQVGGFYIHGERLVPQMYNASAVYVTLDADTVANVSFVPSNKSGESLLDAILEWKDTSTGSSGCALRQNFRLVTISRADEPTVAVPYVYSSRVYEDSFAKINIPLIEVANQGEEYLELKVHPNISSVGFVIETNDGTFKISSNATNSSSVIVRRSDHQDRLKRVEIRIKPNATFIGFARFDIEVSAVHANDELSSIQQYSSACTALHQVVLEWFRTDFASIRPTSLGAAVYRSLPMKLLGDSTLSFNYRISSGKRSAWLSLQRF